MSNTHHVILLAHGSSDSRWCETFENLAAPTLASVPDSAIAYMELAEPTLDQVVADNAGNGIADFTVVPLFLAAGRHLRKDVPAMIERLESEHGVRIHLADPVGMNPKLGSAIQQVVTEELAALRNA